ncbi:pyridoxine 5'-phosphate synthase [Youhaiella tibetensis]|uniref:Pyridoxine 5'-phosphate synthase n=1 Tax=Paradevosia tibetensis TaxID=1447062 RepID=A0A5B9DQ77_9HYPH|nr:pyridoxine 5'-phosphate synthase [Youhaiella tibetensis]AKR56278.1 Pyridoxine 5'-phosphate synthase [Devosia sp. H5989]QEE21333.1 pyridoxine 5'-phosphate synthase [Youhaiella tibetensis]GGF15932.1 pyridoxine 5'-phosphate synthase [Youhaiella tibetensis]
MTKLSVNLNAVAQLRNRRNLPWPSVTGIARIVLDAGASGITVHPRPDERHIRRTDVFELKELLVSEYPQAEFNIEGYPSEEFLALVETADPEQVTLVPDDPQQATSDHGWDFTGKGNFLASVVGRIRTPTRRISLFCDPDAGEAGIAAARATGADRIELYTGPYGGCFDDPTRAEAELAKLADTARAAIAAGMGINAGHDLTLENLPKFQAEVPGVLEASIGHGITADALILGFAEAVRRYREVLGDL